MPVSPVHRQPEPLAWFGSAAGAALLAAEQPRIAALLAARATAPTLWLHPGGVAGSAVVPAGLSLRAVGGGFEGPVRCGLALPLADASVALIVLQHVAEGLPATLLGECVRVLQPGGRLWLLALNPASPYRLRWRRSGLRALAAGRWQQRLRRAGLECTTPVERLGPCWKNANDPAWLRAGCLLAADKRGPDLIAAPVARPAWRPAGVPGALAGSLVRVRPAADSRNPVMEEIAP
ncbi:MAG: methyltransferase domain-containing protein [Pseudoxanthomonas sp.]